MSKLTDKIWLGWFSLCAILETFIAITLYPGSSNPIIGFHWPWWVFGLFALMFVSLAVSVYRSLRRV